VESVNDLLAIPIAPISSKGRRPHFSTMYNPGKVLATLTQPVINDVVKPFAIPEFWKNEAP